MTIEKLKALLESGAITQEEYDEMAANISDPEPAPEPDPEPDPEPTPDPEDTKLSRREVQAIVDRALAKERKKNVDIQKKYDKLQKKVLNDEELRQIEQEEERKEFERQKQELALERNKMYAVKAMKKANIDDAEETMLIMERLVASCEDETDIDDVIELLASCINKQVDKKVEAEVDKRFSDSAYKPKKGENLNGGVNPWKKEQWNVTQQMAIEANNPNMAAQLRKAAGIE